MKKLKHWHVKRGRNLKGEEWVAYYHVVRVGDKIKWTSLGTDRSAALRKWAEIEVKPVPTEAGTFDSVANEYMTWARAAVASGDLAQRTLEDREVYLKQMRPVFGDKPFDAIESQHVRRYLDKRTAKISAKKEMRFLSVMWNWARERGITTLSNPVAGVKMPKETGRDIEVRPQDYWLVWEHGDQLVKDVLELAARLGTRPQEVFGLTWDKVDLASQPATVKVWQNKVKGWRTVMADAELEAILARLRGDRERPKGHVLTDESGAALNPLGAFRYRFTAAREAALAKAEAEGLDHQDFQLRDLRPMAGLAMLDAEGMDAARRLLGHSTERMTAHYTTKRRGQVSASAKIVRSSSNVSQE
jgi:integrase